MIAVEGEGIVNAVETIKFYNQKLQRIDFDSILPTKRVNGLLYIVDGEIPIKKDDKFSFTMTNKINVLYDEKLYEYPLYQLLEGQSSAIDIPHPQTQKKGKV